MNTNIRPSGIVAILLALASTSAFARPIQVDMGWTYETEGSYVDGLIPGSSAEGIRFCANGFTQVWVSTDSNCGGTGGPGTSPFIQVLSGVTDPVAARFQVNTAGLSSSDFRVRWITYNPDVPFVSDFAVFATELYVYSAYGTGGAAGDFDFDFSYGARSSGNSNDYTVLGPQILALGTTPIYVSTGLTAAADPLRYCYRQSNGGYVGTVSGQACQQIAVPEPTTLGLFLSAIGGLAVTRRRLFRN